MNTRKKIMISLGISAIVAGILIQTRNHNESVHNDIPEGDKGTTSSMETKKDATQDLTAATEEKNDSQPQGACIRTTYEHQAKNRNRDLEEFMNDLNAFQIDEPKFNPVSLCVKVNQKPVSHKIVKLGKKQEVLIGSVVGPESVVEVSYCVGETNCKAGCKVAHENKVDELLNDHEISGIENSELENQVKELRKIASTHEEWIDSTVIRNWNRLESQQWECKKN